MGEHPSPHLRRDSYGHFDLTPLVVTITSSAQGFRVFAYRAQLGRLGGSRWGWVLQIKFPCHTNQGSLTGQERCVANDESARTHTVFPHGPHTLYSSDLLFKAVQAVVTVSNPHNRNGVSTWPLIHFSEHLRNARTNIMKGSRGAVSTPAASPPPASALAPYLLHLCLLRPPPRARLACEPPAAASPLVRPQFHAPRHRAYS